MSVVESSDSVEPAGRAQRWTEELLARALDGFGPFKSASDAADEAMRGRSTDKAIKALVKTHALFAGAQGFVTGVPGLLALPLTLPANIAANLLVHAHLAGAIACVHGHDLHEEEVRLGVLLCLAGGSGTKVLSELGVQAGSKLAMSMVARVPVSVLTDINKRVGFHLLAKYGTKRATFTLAKGVPLVGGVVGGGIDAAGILTAGKFADKFFRPAD